MTTPLAARLRARIAVEGPLTVAAFMAEALAHPQHGYYMRRDPFGRAGDFTTAPEISQTFGELLGLWCADLWQRAGAPTPVRLVELGPGRGTLLADAWRAVGVLPAFREAARLHLVEISPALRAVQRATLAAAGVPEPAWHDALADVPDGPVLLIANELFDALPVHQFLRTEAGWRERLVDADTGDESDEDEGGFRFVLARQGAPLAALIPEAVRSAPVGSIAEVSPAAISLAAEIGGRVAAQGGAALIVDYGPAESGPGDTLQAVRRHRRHDPLADPGEADLTAHVDFATLARAAGEAGARIHGPAPQGAFLRRLGIEARLQALLRRATPAQAADIALGVRRLIAPEEMGTLFKVLAATHPAWPAPAGFEDAAPATASGTRA